MKRFAWLIALLLVGGAAALGTTDGNKAEISFDHLSHNFGTLEQGGEKVTHLFEFANIGEAPLVITRTTSSCRCISIKAPKRPIRAGESGVIEVTYEPKDVGVFNKGIDILANIEGGRVTLFVTGEVK